MTVQPRNVREVLANARPDSIGLVSKIARFIYLVLRLWFEVDLDRRLASKTLRGTFRTRWRQSPFCTVRFTRREEVTVTVACIEADASDAIVCDRHGIGAVKPDMLLAEEIEARLIRGPSPTQISFFGRHVLPRKSSVGCNIR